MTLPIWIIKNVFKTTQKSVISTNVTLEDPYRTAFVMGGEDVTVDIEDGVTVSVDDGCVFMVVDPPADALGETTGGR